MTRQTTPMAASARPHRTPLSQRNRLSIRNREPGYQYRIVNTNLEKDPDRVQGFLDMGYEIVPAEAAGATGDKRVDNPSPLGSSSQLSVGQGTKAVVMRIRDDWYKEDQAEKQANIDRSEQSMQAEARRTGLYGKLQTNANIND